MGSVRTMGDEGKSLDPKAQIEMLWSELHKADDDNRKLRAQLDTRDEIGPEYENMSPRQRIERDLRTGLATALDEIDRMQDDIEQLHRVEHERDLFHEQRDQAEARVERVIKQREKLSARLAIDAQPLLDAQVDAVTHVLLCLGNPAKEQAINFLFGAPHTTNEYRDEWRARDPFEFWCHLDLANRRRLLDWVMDQVERP